MTTSRSRHKEAALQQAVPRRAAGAGGQTADLKLNIRVRSRRGPAAHYNFQGSASAAAHRRTQPREARRVAILDDILSITTLATVDATPTAYGYGQCGRPDAGMW